jgi:AraC-like DNA-binding protein
MTTLRAPAHVALKPYVEAILVSESAAAETYTVLPTPCAVLGVQSSGRVTVVDVAGERTLGQSGITALLPAAKRFRGETGTRSVLVYLKPYGAFRLLGCHMGEISGEHPALSSLLPSAETRELEGRVAEGDDPVEAVEEFLVRRLARSAHEEHPAVVHAVRRMVETRGTERVEMVAGEVSFGRRQLERLFRLQVGLTPKEFSSLVRFDWAVRNLSSRTSWADLALDAGYADQAHFVRSFSRWAGTSPDRFARRPAG